MRMTPRVRPRPVLRTALGVLALATPLALAGCGSDEPTPAADSGGGDSTAAATVECPPAEGADERTTDFASAPPMCLTPGADYSAVITTDAGQVTVDLLEDKAPETVNNFVFLARNHFYDGVSFHRVIPGFMVQGGDPQGTGSGGPGYRFADELPSAGEYEVGSMAMANAGPDTNGSQFFIVTGDAGVSLPPSYSLFGTVTEGMETVTAIEDDGSSQGTPSTTHVIESVEIIEN